MTQKDRIYELMKKTNIESDKALLIKIIEMIGKERVTIDKYEKKKSNFSKMGTMKSQLLVLAMTPLKKAMVFLASGFPLTS